MTTLALIPARGGSKGIPRKNIADLGGKPLIVWTIEAARAARSVARVVVSTDDDEIAAVALAAGADVPFRRPADIAADDATALAVAKHAIDWLQQHDGWTAETIAYLQPTSPFRTVEDIDSACALLAARNADTVVSVTAVPHNMSPTSLMRLSDGYLEFVAAPAQRLFSRQQKEKLFARNGPAVLVNRRHVIDSGMLYGNTIAAYEMTRLASLDIDEPEDLLLARKLFPLFNRKADLSS